MDVFRQLKPYFWQYRYYLVFSVFSMLTATALGIVYPNLLRILIDDVISAGQFERIPALTAVLFGVIGLKALFMFSQGFFGGRLGNRLAFNLRNASYEKIQFLSFRYFDRAKTGDLMSRLTADLEAIRLFVGFGFTQLVNLFAMVVFGAISMAMMDWQLTLITLATIPVLAFFAVRFEKRIHPAFRDIRASMSRLTSAMQENVTGVRTVKSFAREPHEVEKFSGRNGEYKENQLTMSRIWAKYFPFMDFITNASVVVLLVTGGLFVIEGKMLLGELAAFFTLIWYIIGPMWGLGFHINNYTQSKASSERIMEMLDHPFEVKNEDEAVELDPALVRGHVIMKDVTFSYPNQPPALTNINLDAHPGKITGILGGTGAGKSTLIQLMIRAYNLKRGTILFDGFDIKWLDLQSLRSQVSIVFQETFLFSSSIRNNIAYGNNDVSFEEIVAAAKKAQAHNFIMEFPDGYDTVVGERGMGLSGGQKQRIAIARALLSPSKVLVLDDATSAVDMETEQSIQKALKSEGGRRTTFIIAHRISSLKHADEIIVLDQGHVVQRGTHEELLAQDGPYLDTFRMQYADKPEEMLPSPEAGDRTSSSSDAAGRPNGWPTSGGPQISANAQPAVYKSDQGTSDKGDLRV